MWLLRVPRELTSSDSQDVQPSTLCHDLRNHLRGDLSVSEIRLDAEDLDVLAELVDERLCLVKVSLGGRIRERDRVEPERGKVESSSTSDALRAAALERDEKEYQGRQLAHVGGLGSREARLNEDSSGKAERATYVMRTTLLVRVEDVDIVERGRGRCAGGSVVEMRVW
jgi:hypothetical protein